MLLSFHSISVFVLVHDKACNKTCTTSKDSDQPAHPCSLIGVFADRICLLQPPGYPKRDNWEALLCWVDVQADLSLCCHTGLIVGFVMRWLISISPLNDKSRDMRKHLLTCAPNEDSNQPVHLPSPISFHYPYEDLLCWGLTTCQPLWVILCRLPEEGRKEIEETVEMKERDRKKEKQEWKWRNRRNKNITPLPLPATRIAGLAQL